jgi:hypothetical protein
MLKKRKFTVLLILVNIVMIFSACGKNPNNDFVSSDADIPENSKIQTSQSNESIVSDKEEINNQSTVAESLELNNSSNTSNPVVSKVCSHNYQATVIEKTCIKNGYTQYVCNECGHSYKDNVVSSGHNFVNNYCSVCNIADKSKAGIIVYNWLQENGVSEQYYSSKVYNFGNDLYKISGLNNGWLFFEYNNDNEDKYIELSVYSADLKDDCYLEYLKGDSKVEYEFHKENIHSNQPNGVWNQMNHYGSIDKSQMISEIRSEIDGFMLQFQNNVLNKLGLTLKDLGFTCYN